MRNVAVVPLDIDAGASRKIDLNRLWIVGCRWGFERRLHEYKYRMDDSGWIAEFGQVPVKSKFALQDLFYPGVVMAQQCDICGKKPQAGNRISHAHNVTKRRWNINLRPVHAKVAGQGKRIRVCTSCLRSGKVVKA